MQAKTLAAAAVGILVACNQTPTATDKPATAQGPQFVRAMTSSNPVAEGERVAHILGCLGCHGLDLQGAIWDEEPEFGVVAPSNLTRSAAIHSDAQLERMIREGVRPDGSALWEMPSETFTHLGDEDMRALLAYLRSIPPAGPERPRPVFGPGAKRAVEAGQLLPAPQKVVMERLQEPRPGGPEHEPGRYIARLACGECHGAKLEGNDDPFRPDLIVASGYSLEEFRRLLKTGEPTGGRRLELMAQVAKSRFSHLSDDEIDALHGYLVARARQAR